MKLTEGLKDKILQHAKNESPKECCGLIAIIKGRKRYFPCKNIAEGPEEHFIIDPDDYIKTEDKGEIIAVVHSHPSYSPKPSEADLVACEKSELPWFIVNPDNNEWDQCEPKGYELPFVGREFSHGIVDCYTLWKDFYERELGIKMGDYFRRDDWWNRGENLYLDNFKKEGMYEISQDEIQYGDIILMHIESPVPNHAAIYIGDSIILHHVHGRLSSRDVYGGYYKKNTAKVIRHESR